MFSGQSRRDHTHLVRWPQFFSSSEPSRQTLWSSGGNISFQLGHNLLVYVTRTSVPGNYRPISLVSCCFKVLEHMVHHCQGGFRWGADMMAGSLRDVLHMRSATHTFVAFVDIFKAFDTCWVEATMVELFSMRAHVGVDCTFCAWHVLASQKWFPSVRTLAGFRYCPGQSALSVALQHSRLGLHGRSGVSLMASWDSRFAGQLYADDLVVVADSAADLQTGLDALSAWGFRYRFTFGVGPSTSAAMIFGPRRNLPACNVTLGSIALPMVSEYKNLGVVLSPTLSWAAHVQHVVNRGNRLFAQCVSWCRAERLRLHITSSIFLVYVLPSIAWGGIPCRIPHCRQESGSCIAQVGSVPVGLAHWFAQCWCLG